MYSAILFDLDGTVYHRGVALPGAPELFFELQRRGVAYRFVTNRSNRTPELIALQLKRLGVPARAEQVLTSAHAVPAVAKDKRVFAIGGQGLLEALNGCGASLDETRPDLVVVGFDEHFTVEKLKTVSRLVSAGVPFYSTNPDPYIYIESGLYPENGAIIAAIETASGVKATVLGKPKPALIFLAMQQLSVSASQTMFVGDNPDTDIACALAAGVTATLILTGVTKKSDVPTLSNRPTHIVENYADLTELLAFDR